MRGCYSAAEHYRTGGELAAAQYWDALVGRHAAARQGNVLKLQDSVQGVQGSAQRCRVDAREAAGATAAGVVYRSN